MSMLDKIKKSVDKYNKSGKGKTLKEEFNRNYKKILSDSSIEDIKKLESKK